MTKAIIAKRHREERRAIRVRAKLSGTTERPRLSVFRSLKHISAQLIDDTTSKTLATATDLEVKGGKATKTEVAMEVGKLLAKKATEKKIVTAIFDRGSFKYHGRVKAVAEGAREGGLQF